MSIPLSIREFSNQPVEIEIEPSATIAQLKLRIEAKMDCPVASQRLVYAGTQLEDVVTPAWRNRLSQGSALAAATNAESIPEGAPLTLELYGVQKNACINLVRRVNPAAAPSTDPGQSVARQPLCGEPSAEPPSCQSLAPQPAAASSGAAPIVELQREHTPCNPTPPDHAPGNATPPGCAPSGHKAGYGASASQAQAENDFLKQLEHLPDASIQVIFSELLRGRPHLRDTLLKTPPAYRHGDPVKVYSNSSNKWFDGHVNQVQQTQHGQIPAGAVGVQFDMGGGGPLSTKWIAPKDLQTVLKPRR